MQIDDLLYQKYLDFLLAGDKAGCFSLVSDLLRSQIDIKDLYINLFQRSMYEVGHLWEQNKISVAKEHVATAITEGLLGLVYPRIFEAEHIGRTAIISCLANEYHQLGGKMVADIFELNGWDGYFLGANSPLEQLYSAIEEKQPEVLALSLSVCFNFDQLYRALDALRGRYPHLPIMVGGQAFLWGGSDIGQRFPGVTYVANLSELELLIQSSEALSVKRIQQGGLL